ncbi:hypothetical protein HYD74_03845 [Mycoplasmopsis bovis]|nr:hypothetical protein HYD74_03845 [Mycoplasmopsis bovis]
MIKKLEEFQKEMTSKKKRSDKIQSWIKDKQQQIRSNQTRQQQSRAISTSNSKSGTINSIKQFLSVIQFFLSSKKYSKPILCLLLF